MKTTPVRVDWLNRRFVRDIYYGVEDGLPEGYTLYLEETAHPEDRTFYKNGNFGGWDYSPQTLILNYHKWDDNQKIDESIELCTVDTNALYWLDIYDGMIIYSSTGGRYENMVLYNIQTRQKLVIDKTFIPKDDEYDHFRDPKLWVHSNVVYVQFEAVDGWYDGGENCGSRIFCFEKDTLKQLEFKDTDDSGADVWEAIENRGTDIINCNGGPKKHFYHANLYPDTFNNRYKVKTLTSTIHDVEYRQAKHKDCPRSVIKQMYKIRLAYAKENHLEITPYNIKPFHQTIWHKLGKLFEKLGDKVDRRRDKHLDKIRKKYQK